MLLIMFMFFDDFGLFGDFDDLDHSESFHVFVNVYFDDVDDFDFL